MPDEVVARLEALAARQSMSVSALAVGELGEVSRRADDPALLADLPDRQISAAGLVQALHEERSGR